MIILGDVHGKWDRLNQICKVYSDRTILCLGDVGVGFPGGTPKLPDNFRFFRGNHDNPEICRTHQNSIKIDHGMYNGVYIVAGADSIDKGYRTPGVTWWSNEQMSREEMEIALDEYCKIKPDVLVCHEAPFRLHRMQHEASCIYDPSNRSWGEPKGNSTAFLLDSMIQRHMPKMLIHGHWHNPLVYRQWGCSFVSLGELEPFDLDDALVRLMPTSR